MSTALKPESDELLLLFIRETRESFPDWEIACERFDTTGEVQQLNAIRRILHRLKGTASTLNLYELAEYLHLVEEQVHQTELDGDRPWETVSYLKQVRETLEQWMKNLEAHSPLPPRSLSSGPKLQPAKQLKVPYDQVLKLLSLQLKVTEAMTGAPLAVKQLIQTQKQCLERLLFTPIEAIFERITIIAEKTARSQSKLLDVHITADDIIVLDEVRGALYDCLIQLVRNAVVHGFESLEQRVQLGKNEIGQLHLRAKIQNNFIEIDVEDDGAGLNTEEIRKKAITESRITPGDSLSITEVHQIIFESGFSTAEEISTLAGRGMGLDLVYDLCERLGGSIQVRSKSSKGCLFSLSFPQDKISPNLNTLIKSHK